MSNKLDTWNYRVLQHNRSGNIWLDIHAVFYDENNRPVSCEMNPSSLASESIDELKDSLILMLSSLNKPILDYDKLISVKK